MGSSTAGCEFGRECLLLLPLCREAARPLPAHERLDCSWRELPVGNAPQSGRSAQHPLISDAAICNMIDRQGRRVAWKLGASSLWLHGTMAVGVSVPPRSLALQQRDKQLVVDR